MTYFSVRGGAPLYGSVFLPAAKNAVLPILASSVLVRAPICLQNCPDITDVQAMCMLLEGLGASVRRDGDALWVDCTGINNGVCSQDYCGCMRSSLFLLGSVLGRVGEVTLGMPGGCVIGARPIDIHLHGLAAFGVSIQEEDGVLHCWVDSSKVNPCRYRLSYPSVCATVNLLCFALSLEGESTLDNVAQEPEIKDLVSFLRSCGAEIEQNGGRITVRGGKSLHTTRYRPIGDRIVAATVLCAAALCGGDVTIEGVAPAHVHALTHKLGKYSCFLQENCDTIRLRSNGRPRSICCQTAPFPGFATDMQALAMAYDSASQGCAVIRERVFESRFALAAQLVRMGAAIRTMGDCAFVLGRRLHAAEVVSCDLRAGAALVVAALSVKGESKVYGVELVDRGYQNLEKLFSSIGADVVRNER